MANNIAVLVVSFVVSMICLYALGCYRKIARTVPLNYILLAIFTISESYLVSCITMGYEPKMVATAAVMTAAVTLSLTAYAFSDKSKDFTIMGGMWFMFFGIIIAAAFVNFFVRSPILQIILSCCFAVIFGVYIIYDTQLIVGKKELALEIDDYIFGAMMLYLDIINLFLELLRIIGYFTGDSN